MRLNMTARQQRQALSIVAMSVRLALAPADGLNPVQHEAMDDASTPPPGLYYLGYFLNYRSNNLRTPVSNERVPGDVRVENTSFVNRLMWITDSKLLGADYGMEVIVPMVHSSMHSSTYGLDRHESGGSDIYVSPLILGWHMPRWDVSAGAGVWLDSSEGPEALVGDLDALSIIAVNFPKFADGRSYSTAHLLRERYGYRGEIRAIGDVLHDQLFFMKRCGIDAYAVRADKDIEAALAGLSTFSDAYQAAVDQPQPLFRRRAA